MIVDNDSGAPAYTETGTWSLSTSSGYNGGSYKFATSGQAATATWTANLSQAGTYRVSVIYRASTNRVTSAKYSIATSGGTQYAYVNQQNNNLVWVVLGNYSFNAGNNTITLDAAGSTPTGSAVIADAVQFNLVTTSSFTSIAAEDGYVRESSETSNVGGSNISTNTANYVGDNYTKIQYKIILSFDTSSLPDNANIISATLKQKRYTISGDPSVLGSMLVDIKNPTFGTAELENTDFEAVASATGVATMSYPTSNGTWSTGSVNSTGLGYINKTGKTQFKVYFTTDDDNDGTTDYLGFYAGDYGTAADRPQIEIQYTLP